MEKWYFPTTTFRKQCFPNNTNWKEQFDNQKALSFSQRQGSNSRTKYKKKKKIRKQNYQIISIKMRDIFQQNKKGGYQRNKPKTAWPKNLYSTVV